MLLIAQRRPEKAGLPVRSELTKQTWQAVDGKNPGAHN
jgi:hypothetical protein